ncbi:hypothetical protein EYR40_008060 [Pleurotus pulmonarius]|nr:hypothetical protein EYR36_008905 [Pleurotus pulmonarius]KAF4596254.1 hypothetical protein EYR38_007631 [Pleurotus pulmonarius]KAF4597598.1 hypothetical protein EYR40_008060 [Pleurotus pulmonarius]
MLPQLSYADCFSILGLSTNATNEQIKVAYKRLALQWHPDRHAENKDFATERFVEVSNAYRTVLRERRSHSQDLREVPQPPGSPRNFPIPTSLGHVSSGYNSSTDSSSTQDSYHFQAKDIGGDAYFVHTLPYQHQQGTPRKSERYDPAPTPIPRKATLPTEARESSRRRNAEQGWERTTTSPKRRTTTPLYADTTHEQTFVHPGDIPSEWIFYLHLSLEELFKGKTCRFQLTRQLRSGRQKEAVVDFRIPPGCHHGTRFVCRGVGHERADGSTQDVVFIVDELRHDRFFRIEDDLMANVIVPWASYAGAGGQIYVEGLDGKQHAIVQPQQSSGRRLALKGVRTIVGAGMPISEGERVIGRGDLVVCWEVAHPSAASRWDGLKRALHLRR